MEENKKVGSGVVSVFDAIASGRDKPKGDKVRSHKSVVENRGEDRAESTTKKEKPPGERPKARTGRFPGRTNGPVKEKMTGRITPELKDAYVDWALDDRCPLSDLMERALTEFYQRYRAGTAKKK